MCRAWTRATLGLVVLLGVFWLLAPIAALAGAIAIDYTHIVLNSSEGLAIFLFTVILPDKVWCLVSGSSLHLKITFAIFESVCFVLVHRCEPRPGTLLRHAVCERDVRRRRAR